MLGFITASNADISNHCSGDLGNLLVVTGILCWKFFSE